MSQKRSIGVIFIIGVVIITSMVRNSHAQKSREISSEDVSVVCLARQGKNLPSLPITRRTLCGASIYNSQKRKKVKEALQLNTWRGWDSSSPLSDIREKKIAWRKELKAMLESEGFQIAGYYGTNKREGGAPKNTLKIGIDGKLLGNLLHFSNMRERMRPHCKSYTEFRKGVIQSIQASIDDGVFSFTFDDPLKKVIQFACYCDLCCKNFRVFVRGNPQYVELFRSHGITDLDSFHLRNYINKKWSGSAAELRKKFSASFIFPAWKAFKYQLGKEFFQEVACSLRSYARQKYGRELYLDFNGWMFWLNNRNCTLLDSMDGVWQEFEVHVDSKIPFDGGMSSFIQLFRGRQKLVSLFPSNGAALAKIYAKRSSTANFYKLFMAEVYASGGMFDFQRIQIGEKQIHSRKMKARDLQTFDPLIYDRNKTGDVMIDIDAIGSYTRFIKNNPSLFPEVFENADHFREIAILKVAPDFSGYRDDNSVGWLSLLNAAHYPCRFIFEGTGDLMADTFNEDSLVNVKTVILLSPFNNLTANQQSILIAFHAGGGRIIHVTTQSAAGRFSARKDGYHVQKDDLGARYRKSQDRSLFVKLKKRIGPSPIQTNLPESVLIQTEKVGRRTLIHLVNRNYDWVSDKVASVNHVTITLDRKRFSIGRIDNLKVYSPDGDAYENVSYQVDGNTIRFDLNALHIYSVLSFETEPTGQTVTK